MEKIKQAYNRQSVPTRILISVLINLIIVVAVINVTLYVQFDSIKKAQLDSTSNFFDQYNKFALGQAAEQAKQLLLSVMDNRLIYINLIRTFVLKHGQENSFTNSPCVLLNEKTTKNELRTGCFFTDEQNSIFNRNTFENLEKIMQASWWVQLSATSRRVKRVNIILQNRQNLKDIMVKTIPRDPDFIIGDVADILQAMYSRRSGIVTLSTPYKDTRSRSSPNVTLISLRSKTIFLTPEKNYTMLIELEVFERFINIPLSRVILSNEVNVAMLHINSQLPQGYQFIASYTPLDDNVNYSQLLREGYKRHVLPNNSILHAYTEPISSTYFAGQYNGNSKDVINKEYCYVITAPSISFKMKTAIDSFIYSLFSSNISFLILWTIALLIIIFTLTFFTTTEIRDCLAFCKKSIHNYLYRLEKPEEIVKNLHMYCFRWQPFTYVLRTVGRIIRQIQLKKLKARKMTIDVQRYPLNMLESHFADKHLKFDHHKFVEWFEIIKQNKGLQKSKEEAVTQKQAL